MFSIEELQKRFIPFESLRYSTEAFIDYRIPECSPKYNYALIGSGVSQNPSQPVSLREKHGFQVGGVSMPHGKSNPAHMHFTCEVFMCVRGEWEIQWGFNPDAQSTRISAGDMVSVPTWIYRGFKNVGADDGFMFTTLGGDDTGGILWGPTTLEAAAKQGVYLTDDYQIIDTLAGQKMQAPLKALTPMSLQEIQQLRVWSLQEMAQRVVLKKNLQWSTHGFLDSILTDHGAQLAPVLGLGISQDRDTQAPISNPHEVSIEWLRIPAHGQIGRHRLQEKQVVIGIEGVIELEIDSMSTPYKQNIGGGDNAWDTYAIPAAVWRSFKNNSSKDCFAWLLTSGDHRKKIQWDDLIIEQAAAKNRAIDANGYVAPKHYVDRSQR
ncbi:MAG: cupin domain-containing protein [Burkholderiales bacterium]|nr:cupin domain-containing protein [Burkholderiales bacterium]